MSNSLNYKTWLERNLLLWYIAEKFNISTNDILQFVDFDLKEYRSHFKNKKAFQWDAYYPLANRTCFGDHQMSVLVGVLSLNRSPVMPPDVTGGGGSSSEQV